MAMLPVPGLLISVFCGPLLFFLFGSIPFGYFAGRYNGIDLRSQGSGNIGATNVFRVLGKKWGFAIFIADFLKGFIPLFIFKLELFPMWNVKELPLLMIIPEKLGGNSGFNEALLALFGLCAILGHNYTPWLRFKGGKGIATSAGVLAALTPWTLLIIFSLWYLIFKISRTVSIASITSCVVLPFIVYFFHPHNIALQIFSLLIGLTGLWRHRANIGRLCSGTELKMNSSSKKSS